MAARPGALFIVDIIHEINALKEARKLGIPVVAIVDTNADPSLVAYPIPANDDAIKTIQLITDHVKLAIERGKLEPKKTADTKDKQE
jgi:small subunit ribosomal protein S2